jgi:hypothetical protein
MRKFLLSFFVVFFLLGFSSCGSKDNESKKTHGLRMELNDPFTQIGSVVETSQGRVAISDFKLYLSDLYVHYAEGDSALWAEVAMVDFEKNETLENFIFPVPARQIVAVSAGLGLKPEMNEGADPGDFAPEHPLSFQSSNGMHWGWETGYKFLVFDAKIDTGSGNFDWPISYHVGTSELYKRFKISTDNESGLLIFVDDLGQLFSKNVLNMDVIESPQTHTINNKVVAEKFRDAFISSLSVK